MLCFALGGIAGEMVYFSSVRSNCCEGDLLLALGLVKKIEHSMSERCLGSHEAAISSWIKAPQFDAFLPNISVRESRILRAAYCNAKMKIVDNGLAFDKLARVLLSEPLLTARCLERLLKMLMF